MKEIKLNDIKEGKKYIDEYGDTQEIEGVIVTVRDVADNKTRLLTLDEFIDDIDMFVVEEEV